MSDHLILVDASGFAFRAYYSGSPRYRPSDGEPTGAIEIFMSMVWRMLGRAAADRPTMGAAIFDAPGQTFRHKIDPDYKGNRDPARRVELDKQFPIMRNAAEVLGLVPLEKPGFEADDLIATIARKAMAKDIRVTIVSSDKDFAQCVVDGQVEIVDAMLRKRVITKDVVKRFGVKPELVPHVQALAGDAIDNIHGVDGCGEEKAAALVRRFGGVEQILANVDDVRWPQVRNGLRNGADRLRRDLQLATLRADVPFKLKFEDLRLKPVMKSHLVQICRALECSGRIQSIFGFDLELVRVVPHVKDPLEWWREELKVAGQQVGDEPQCGYYMRKVQRGGQFVPAKIWRDPEFDQITDKPTGRDLLQCQLGLTRKDARAEWPSLSMKPIAKAEYELMMRKWQPNQPPPPTGKTNWATAPTPDFKQRKKA